MSDQPDTREVEVHVLGMPLATYAEAEEHLAALTREFHLIAGSVHDEDHEHRAVPRRLLSVVETITERYAGVGDAQDAERDRAFAEGAETMDLTYRLPASIAQAVGDLDRMLDEADDFCRQGELLTLATPPHLVAVRRWYLGEFIRQVGGAAPLAWADYLAQQPADVRAAAQGS